MILPSTGRTGKIITNQAEQYRMNDLLVGFPVLFIFLMCILPVCAQAGPLNLSFASVTEEGGYIVAEVTAGGSDAGYLAFWLNTLPGDCSTSHLLGWQYLNAGDEQTQIIMKGPVPYGITPGTCEVQINFKPGTEIPGACDKGTVARMNMVLATPGTGTRDMAATLSGGNGNVSSGPDYRIEAISGIDTAIRMTPSSTLSPSVTVSNSGTDDGTGLPVEVHAYLGSEELIPVVATIAPVKAGESRTVQLSYQIPGTISQRSYPFFMIIDPRGVQGTADAATNLERTGGQMMVREEEADPLAEHGCGCK